MWTYDGGGVARGATANWTNPAGGTFNVAGNWNDGAGPAPGTSDSPTFGLASTYAVNFTTSASQTSPATTTSGNAFVTAGDVTWLASGGTRNYVPANLIVQAGGRLTIGGGPAGTPVLNVGGGQFGPRMGGVINVLSGISAASSTLDVSGTTTGVTAPATVNVSGAGTQLNGRQLRLGGSSFADKGALTYADGASGTFDNTMTLNNGSLTLTGGADIIAKGEVFVGPATTFGGTSATLALSGVGTTFSQPVFGTLPIGASSGNPTTVTVSDGATLSTGSITLSRTATLDLTGGTVDAGNGTVIDGGVLRSTSTTGVYKTSMGTSMFTVKNGGRAELAGSFDVAPAGSMNATFTVTGSTSQFTNTGEFRVNNIGVANVQAGGRLTTVSIRTNLGGRTTVDGAGSTLVTGALTQDHFSDSFNVRNGAGATFSGNVNVNGSVDVSNGTKVTVSGDIVIVRSGITTGAASLSISGPAASSLTQTGAGRIVVGSAAAGGYISSSSNGTLTTGTGGLVVNPRGQLFASGLTVNANGNVTFTGAATAPLSSIVNTINLAAGNALSVDNTGVTLSGNLTLASTNTLTVSGANGRLSTAKLTVNGGRATVGAGSSLLVTSPIAVSGGGQIDLADGGAIVARGSAAGTATGGTYTGVSGLVQSGDVMTSAADAVSGLTSIGVATADDVGRVGTTYAGWSLQSGDVIAAYTYAGDANLDGIVSGDDYSAIDFSILVPGSYGWVNGDFNYDGQVTGDDYSAIDFNILAQGAPIAHGAGAGESAVTAVPEPAGCVAVLVAAMAMAARSRRRRS